MEQNITALRIALEVGLEEVNNLLSQITFAVCESNNQLERIAIALEKIANKHGREF